MKKVISSVLGMGVALAAASGAMAQEVEVSGNVSLTSNYVFRGITQTDDGPAIQGGFDVAKGGWYAGTWASSVDFGDDTTMEIDFYGGYSGSLTENTSYDVGVIYYAYPDSPQVGGGDQDFYEVYGGISHSFGAVSAGVSVAYSPEFYGETGEAFYTQASLDYAATDALSFGATYGLSDIDEGSDYDDWSIGAFYSAIGLDFGLVYTDTDIDGADSDAVAFSVGKSM